MFKVEKGMPLSMRFTEVSFKVDLKLLRAESCYLQVDLNDSVKLFLLHAEQEVVLSDARCVHTYWGRLEVTGLHRNTSRLEDKKTRRSRSQAASHTCMLVTSFFTLSFDDTSTTVAVWTWPLKSSGRLLNVSFADSWLMSATTTEAPSEAKRWHTARPIPLPPPGRKGEKI